MDKIFVKANEKATAECLEKAHAWFSENSQHMFTSTRSTAVGAVAEYLANEKGYTLYDCNAKYPKVKS